MGLLKAMINVVEGGEILFLLEYHFFQIKMGLDPGTSNYIELLTLKLLISFAGEKGCHAIQIFGDSMNVVNWVMGTQRCHNWLLLALLEEIWCFKDSFDFFSFRHVHRE